MPSLPVEVLRNIANCFDAGDEIRGRGVAMTSMKFAMISRDFNAAQKSCLARVPLVKVRTGAMVDEVDANGQVVRYKKGKSKGEVKQVPVFEMKPEFVLPGAALRVGELLVWRDLTEALDCVTANLENDAFWLEIRAIFLDFSDDHINGTYPPFAFLSNRPRYYKKAHWVFKHMAIIFRRLHFEKGGHNLHWLRIRLVDWSSIRSMDVGGMFGLSQIPAVPRLSFVPGEVDRCLSNYMDADVREVLVQRTSRRTKVEWEPTGLEDPCPQVKWREQALRGAPGHLSENERCFRFLSRRYDTMYKL